MSPQFKAPSGGRIEGWGGAWGGVSPSKPTMEFGERHELPQCRGSGAAGRSPSRKRILAYFEGHMQNAPFCT